jgi:acyl-coenzyme A thioesterase PaaI-like protein
VTYLRPLTKDSGLIRATGRLTKPGRKVAYATVEVTDRTGKLVAQATSSCLVMDNRDTAPTG